MAGDTLRDRASAVNSSLSSTSNTQDLPLDAFDWEDHIEDHLNKAIALISIAQGGGISQCSESSQHYFLCVLDDLLHEMKKGLQAVHELKSKS